MEFHQLAWLGTNQMRIAHSLTICVQFESRLGVAAEERGRESAAERRRSRYVGQTSFIFMGSVVDGSVGGSIARTLPSFISHHVIHIREINTIIMFSIFFHRFHALQERV